MLAYCADMYARTCTETAKFSQACSISQGSRLPSTEWTLVQSNYRVNLEKIIPRDSGSKYSFMLSWRGYPGAPAAPELRVGLCWERCQVMIPARYSPHRPGCLSDCLYLIRHDHAERCTCT